MLRPRASTMLNPANRLTRYLFLISVTPFLPRARTHTCAYAWFRACSHTRTHAWFRAYSHTHAHAWFRACSRIYTHAYSRTRTHSHTCTHIHSHAAHTSPNHTFSIFHRSARSSHTFIVPHSPCTRNRSNCGNPPALKQQSTLPPQCVCTPLRSVPNACHWHTSSADHLAPLNLCRLLGSELLQ